MCVCVCVREREREGRSEREKQRKRSSEIVVVVFDCRSKSASLNSPPFIFPYLSQITLSPAAPPKSQSITAAPAVSSLPTLRPTVGLALGRGSAALLELLIIACLPRARRSAAALSACSVVVFPALSRPRRMTRTSSLAVAHSTRPERSVYMFFKEEKKERERRVMLLKKIRGENLDLRVFENKKEKSRPLPPPLFSFSRLKSSSVLFYLFHVVDLID